MIIFGILTLNVMGGYNKNVIKSFICKESEKIFNRQFSKKLQHNTQQIAFRKLRMLNRSNTKNDLKNPLDNRLEQLSGDRKGQFSIRINNQWRICFIWAEGYVSDVEIVDYHK